MFRPTVVLVGWLCAVLVSLARAALVDPCACDFSTSSSSTFAAAINPGAAAASAASDDQSGCGEACWYQPNWPDPATTWCCPDGYRCYYGEDGPQCCAAADCCGMGGYDPGLCSYCLQPGQFCCDTCNGDMDDAMPCWDGERCCGQCARECAENKWHACPGENLSPAAAGLVAGLPAFLQKCLCKSILLQTNRNYPLSMALLVTAVLLMVLSQHSGFFATVAEPTEGCDCGLEGCDVSCVDSVYTNGTTEKWCCGSGLLCVIGEGVSSLHQCCPGADACGVQDVQYCFSCLSEGHFCCDTCNGDPDDFMQCRDGERCCGQCQQFCAESKWHACPNEVMSPATTGLVVGLVCGGALVIVCVVLAAVIVNMRKSLKYHRIGEKT
ncbi:hypothetical protein Pelo_17243 [Pelomyxa schiedti]|nr:hypothetical protein Pelo_17243 [Pelomyxa schiedti]